MATKSGLTISVVLELIKSGFEKGAKAVESRVNQLKATFVRWFAVITGGAFAFTTLIRSLKETALAVERNRIALKNVTDGAIDFNRAQKFLATTARTYGQDLIALTQGYTGFTAAARQANVPIEDQEKIFEAVSKACATYGLSAERTGLVTLALSQMMSKGKISAEELRRQMGEHLPVAYMAMAKASGLTTAQFEKMMSQGQILSKDILPKFADELNKATANADFDNYITSWTKLKNEIALAVKGLDLPSKIKPVIDAITELFKVAMANIYSIIGAVAGLISGKFVKRFTNSVKDTMASVQTQYDKTTEELKEIDESLSASRTAIKEKETAVHSKYAKTIEKIERDKATKLALLDKKLEALKASSEVNKQRIEALSAQRSVVLAEGNKAKLAQIDASLARQREQLARREAQMQKVTEENKVRVVERCNTAILRAEAVKTNGVNSIAEQELAQTKLVERQKVLETEKANAAAVLSTKRSSQVMRATWTVLSNSMKAMWMSIKTLISMSIFGAIASAIGALIGWITDVIAKAREATRVAKEVNDAVARSDEERAKRASANKDNDAKLLDSNINILKDKKASTSAKQLAAESIQQSYGIQSGYAIENGQYVDKGLLARAELHQKLLQRQRITEGLEEDLASAQKNEENALADRYITHGAKSKNVDAVSYVTAEAPSHKPNDTVAGDAILKANEAIKARQRLESKYAESKREEARLKSIIDGSTQSGTSGDYGGTVDGAKKAFRDGLDGLQKKRAGIDKSVYTDADFAKDRSDLAKKLIEELALALGADAKKDKDYQEALKYYIPDKKSGGGRLEKTTSEKVAEAEKQYVEGLRTAKNQLDAGAKTKAQYDEEVLRLSQRHRDTLSGLLGAEAKQVESFNRANAIVIESSDEFKKLKTAFAKEVNVLNAKLTDGEITEREYASALSELVEEYVSRMYTSMDVGDEERKYIGGLRGTSKALRVGAYNSPKNIGKTDFSSEDDTALISIYDKGASLKEIKDSVARLTERQKEIKDVIKNIIKELKEAGWSESDLKALEEAIDDDKLTEDEVKKLYSIFGDRITKDVAKYASSTDTVNKAVAVGETRSEIKEERRKVASGAYKGVKDLANSTARIARSFKNLRETFDSPDTSGWEKMITLFNTLTQAVETFISIGKGIKAISDYMNLLTKSTEVASAVSTATSATEVATSKAVTSAKVTETVAKTTSAYASLPFIGVALAGAAVGALLAMLTQNAGKFATGGIVGGNSYSGDKVMAMVNSGEMILNQSQQARLFKMANAGAVGGGGVQQTVVVGGTLTAQADKLRMVLRQEAIKRNRL